MNRCTAAGQIFDSWCEVNADLKNPHTKQEVINLKTLNAYLEQELRSHLRTCKNCQTYLTFLTMEVSDEHQKSVPTGESRRHDDRRPETGTLVTR